MYRDVLTNVAKVHTDDICHQVYHHQNKKTQENVDAYN
ncbi:hypothetical protein AMCSP12_000187 [Streptococcus pneumoniae 2070108]|nr:hypothetical protein AMCSP12_000187 [Streptococcus pneumoniae 2070108]